MLEKLYFSYLFTILEKKLFANDGFGYLDRLFHMGASREGFLLL